MHWFNAENSKSREYIFLLLVGVFAWAFFNYRLLDVPPGLNGDEASIGYNAILVSQTLHDENQRFLPLFIQTLDNQDWKQPITFYSTALAFKIFGPSFQLLRQISIIFILISFALLFILLREIFGYFESLAGSLLFLTTPIIMIQSHLALENIAPLPFVILWLLMLLKHQKKPKKIYLFISSLSLGLSFYSYYGMRLIVPVLLILTIIYLTFRKERSLNSLFYFFLGMFPFLAILPWVKTAYPGAIYGSARPIEINSLQELLSPYLSSFDLTFLYFKGDITPYHSTGKSGVFLLATLPLFLIGAYRSIREKNSFTLLTLSAFLFSPLFFGFVGSVHRASRLLVLVPLYIILITLALSQIGQIKKNSLRFTFIILFFLTVSLNYFDFVRDYWFEYPKRIRDSFQSDANITLPKLYEETQKLNASPIIQKEIYEKEKITVKFFEKIYFPNSLKIWQPDNSYLGPTLLLTVKGTPVSGLKIEEFQTGLRDYQLVLFK